MRQLLAIFLLLFSTSGLAAAQDSGSTQTLVQGGVESGFLIAPDFKFTDVNGDFANLAGAYGGWVVDRRFLIGGGVYTMTNGSGPNDMTYGGGVFEYFVNQSSLVNISVRGLIGGGSATLGRGFPELELDFGRGQRPFGLDFPGPAGAPGNVPGFVTDLFGRFTDESDEDLTFAFGETSTSFFVAEPEVDVILNISETFRLAVGGGYRFIGGAGRLQERLNGFTASVALKMSFF